MQNILNEKKALFGDSLMKVVHYMPSIDKSTGGTAIYLQELASSLKTQVDLYVLTSFSENPVDLNEVNVQFLDLSLINIFKLENEALLLFKSIKPDILHLNTIWLPQNHFILNAAQKLNIPIILTPHGMLEPWILSRNPLKKRIAMILYQKKDIKKASIIHATAEMEAVNIRKLGFMNPMVVIPNGIDLSSLPSPKTEYGNKKIVFLSRIHPKKGIEFLLEAWNQIMTTDWVLEIAGDGDPKYIESVLQKIDSLALKSVKFVGPKYGEEKWNFLKSADLFVLPTFSENFGIVIAEALAMGVPVITSKGTPWEELETHQCGWWIDLTLDNIKNALINAMQKNPKDLNKMGNQGIQLISNNYDIKNVAMSLYNEYHTLISNKN